MAHIKRLLFLLLFSFFFTYSYSQPHITAIKGTLNLQNHNWAKDGLVNLDGEWAFYWNALYTPSSFDTGAIAPSAYVQVPGFWNDVAGAGWFKRSFGYATYRLKVLCPRSGERLDLKFLTVASAYTIFVNGKRVAAIGKVGTNAATTIPAFQPVVVPVTSKDNQLDIIIQVANFTYNTGGLWDYIKLGTSEQIAHYRIKNIARDFFIAGSFFLIGLFYLFIYFFFRRRTSPLYFALFCLLIGMRPLVTGELGIYYFANWSWQFTKHVEFVCLYLTVPVLCLFSYELFPKEFSQKILRYILIISVPFIAVAIFTKPYIFRDTVKPFQLLMLLTAGYGLQVYINAMRNRRVGAIYFLAGFIMLFITIINDILKTNLLIHSVNLLYAGLYIFVICQATALSKQFFRAYNKIEILNKQLGERNEELHQKNITINETNEELSKLNAELDTLVFRTSHDLRSPITSVFTIAEIIKTEEDKDKRNEYIELQKKTLKRLNALITEILDYSKNKSTALKFEPVNFEDFVKNALNDHLFASNSQTINRIVEVNQETIFETDKGRLGMVLNNLISNGLKHHNADQENPFLKIVVHATATHAVIEVIDNGPGIEQNQLEHIFTKFYRINKKLSGSGFGLYIVKEAVEKLGGTIRVESEINVGTTFCITIPNGVAV